MLKNNGSAQWFIVVLALLAIAFNTGVTYKHIQNMTVIVHDLVETVDKLADDIGVVKSEVGNIKIIVGNLAENDMNKIQGSYP